MTSPFRRQNQLCMHGFNFPPIRARSLCVTSTLHQSKTTVRDFNFAAIRTSCQHQSESYRVCDYNFEPIRTRYA